MRIVARSAAALLTTAVVVGGTTTAAQAQATTVKDKSSDVVRYADMNDATGTVLGHTDSVATGADVRSLTVKHTKKSVTVTLRFADLKSTTIASVAFRPSGKAKPNRVFVNTGNRSGEVYDLKDKARCTAPVTTKYGRGGSIKATIKRSCLGSPKKIKVSAAAVVYDPTTGGAHADVVSRSSVRGEAWTKWLKAG
jgi:hypothetical protein